MYLVIGIVSAVVSTHGDLKKITTPHPPILTYSMYLVCTSALCVLKNDQITDSELRFQY